MQPLEALSSVERKKRDTTSAPSASRWLHNPDAPPPPKRGLAALLDEWEKWASEQEQKGEGMERKPATERMWWE